MHSRSAVCPGVVTTSTRSSRESSGQIQDYRNLRRARQRVEMRDTPCYDAPTTAYACSVHTEAPPEASSGLLGHGRVPRLVP